MACGLACVQMNGLMLRRGCGKAVCYHRYCSTHYSLHVVLVRSSQVETIVREWGQLNDAGVVGTEERVPLACMRRVVWGMLYADDAEINCLEAGLGARENDDSRRDCVRGSRPHGVGKSDRDNASTKTEPDKPRSTAKQQVEGISRRPSDCT